MDLVSAVPLALAALLVLSLLLFHAVSGVPPVSASRTEAAAVVDLLVQAGLPERAAIYDLGSGWGALVVALAHAFPQARIVGIEMSPLPYWVARLRTRRLANVDLRRGNFYDHDVSDAQALTCYLMMKPMPRLAGFLDGMLREGTPVVALTFWFRGRQPSSVRKGNGLRGAAALYRWPARPHSPP
jgi:hypothetical protein